MQKITTFLTFNNQAVEAAKLYCSLFDGQIQTNVDSEHIVSVQFTLFGQTYIALNGGPSFAFAPGISLMVSCETQDEIDRYWSKLLADGGKEVQCGWLTDKFGVSWQIVPKILGDLVAAKDRTKANRAIAAMMKMQKLDIATLKRAYDGEG